MASLTTLNPPGSSEASFLSKYGFVGNPPPSRACCLLNPFNQKPPGTVSPDSCFRYDARHWQLFEAEAGFALSLIGKRIFFIGCLLERAGNNYSRFADTNASYGSDYKAAVHN
jgi:hypothetical protein